MRFSRVSTCILALWAGTALADPSPKQAAACVAALHARAEPMAKRMREGDAEAEVQLLPVVTASFAFVGSVYKQGVRGPEADALLKAAEKAQSTVSPDDLARAQDACQAQGQQLLTQANYFERQFVSRAARQRIDKLRGSS
ncbi:MAG: hypothetical protein JF606_11545 [Burkholderiales bacterium]|jgi:hypothetical protein|nr:hypothetical protein [Burkholderiales bacterium]